MKSSLKPLISKTQASFQHHMLELLSQILKEQKQNNQILQKVFQVQPQKSPQKSPIEIEQSKYSFLKYLSEKQHQKIQQINSQRQQQNSKVNNLENLMIKFELRLNNTESILNNILKTVKTINQRFSNYHQQPTLLSNEVPTQKQKKINHQKYYSRINQIQPYSDRRQAKIRINFLQMLEDNPINQLQNFKKLVTQWLGIVYRSTASICWNNLQSQSLNFDQTKILFTQNIIYNYVQVMNDIRNSQLIKNLNQKDLGLVVTNIANTESIQVLKYLCKQYPQTKIQAPNLTLMQSIPLIDQRGKIQYDLIKISKGKVNFRYKTQSKDYASQIMIFINYIIQAIDENYDRFQGYIGQFFDNLFTPQVMGENKNNSSISYRQKVKKYTKIAIGRKISKNTPKYTQQEIQNGIFFIKSPKIIRVLTKWVEELFQIIENPKQKILDWHYPLKNHQGQQYHTQFPIRNGLYQYVIQNRRKMFDKMQEIRQSCFKIQSQLTKKEYVSVGKLVHLSEQQVKVGLFSENMKDALSSYLYLQLNQLIHFLLQVPLKVNEKQIGIQGFHFQKKARGELNQINLITFRVYDLLRCKCISGEKEILYLINQLKKKAQRYSQNKMELKFNLVRVKDRLSEGTRDILINAQIFDGPICQIQLSVTSQMDLKQQFLDQYNHFLYQLRRSTMLGPLIQNVSIWTSLQQKSSYFDELASKILKQIVIKPYKDKCEFPNIVRFRGPMTCNNCSGFYHIPRTCLNNWKCNECDQYFCGECHYLGMSQTSRKRQIFGSIFSQQFLEQVKEYTNITQVKNIPEFSFVTKRKFLKAQLSFLRHYKNLEQQQVAQIVIRKSTNQIMTRGFLSEVDASEKDKIQNFIIFGINQKYLQYKKIQELRQICKAKPYIKFINLLYQPNYTDSLQQISDLNKKNKLLDELDQILMNKIFNQIITIPIPNSQIVILAQIKMDGQQLKRKLYKRANLHLLKRFSKVNSSIISLQHRHVTDQLTFQRLSKTIGIQIFQNLCKNVIKLSLNSGNIISIEFLSSMTRVETLLIQSNLLESLKGVEGMQLIMINFDRNMVSSLDPLRNQSNLQFLSGSHNKITTLNGIQELQQLRQISLSNNKIDKLDKYLDKLKKLQILYMRQNLLTEINSLVRSNTLLSISLSQNPIKNLPNLSFLPKIQILSLSQVNLDKIPIDQISSLNQLSQLSLHQNRIQKINDLSRFQKLRLLGLNKNKITKIQGLDGLKLTKLFLDNNQIKVIQGIFSCINTLQQLHLCENPIESCIGLRNVDINFKIFYTFQKLSLQAQKQINKLLVQQIATNNLIHLL